MSSAVEHRLLQLETRAGAVRISAWHRLTNSETTLLYLHGLGSTKEEFSDAVRYPVLDPLSLVAFDFPGCGASTYPAMGELGVEDLAEIAQQVLAELGRTRVIVCGHSLGGLAALLLAHDVSRSEQVTAFVNVEGNLAPEDCFFSRQVTTAHRYQSAAAFFEAFRDRLFESDRFGYALYASGLSAKIEPRAAIAYFRSIVAHTDESPLLEWFLSLAMPKQFVYGEQNEGLSYLPTLARSGVSLAKIPFSSHFPASTNAVAFFNAIGEFARSVM